jgi:peptide/nickel transport system substrate-binding protein
MDNVKSGDVLGLQSNNDLIINSLRGRDYDYVGWNNNVPGKSGKPNKFFSSPEVRKALTYAINREEILHSFLEGYGEICKTPVSPMFKSYFDKSISAYKYDPQKSKEILARNGWVDKNNTGVLEKNLNSIYI